MRVQMEGEVSVAANTTNDNVVRDQQYQTAPNNRVPIVPDDLIIEGIEVYEGQQIFLPVQNTTAGALTYRYRLEIEAAEEY